MKSSEIKNPIELKEYCRPSIKIVLLDESDIVTESDPDGPITTPDGTNNPSQGARQRDYIFDDL